MNAGKRGLVVIAVVGFLALAGCGRSSNKATSSNNSGGSTQAPGSGSFGSMKDVCGIDTSK